WDGIPIGGFKLPMFGFGVLFWLWLVAGLTVFAIVARMPASEKGPRVDLMSIGFWLALGIAIIQAPVFGPKLRPEGAPLFGYGVMLLIGLASAVWLANKRAQREGLPPDVIYDLSFWLFLPGIIGARLFYLVQYRDDVFRNAHTLGQMVFSAINLAGGGIVLYGGLIAGAISYFVFCHQRKLRPLQLADIIVPSVFVGIGFGRIGCLLYGCCYGDKCDLPWAIVFPADSVPVQSLIYRGFLPPDAVASPPLHPTQIYSSLDGFFIAALTLWYHRYRRVPGDVLGLALLISPLTRFLIEFVRGDEFGQWGTTLTISQWISLAIFATGLVFQVYLARVAVGKPTTLPLPTSRSKATAV
ncbi:MAG TPA: prolipoprotein diacylglyceryl transferase, partial [Planctomycetaceae bacterium]|nr:prolipoprotein diacylglyceryl transferase [Planctomycetaceae bacterium]